MKRRAVTVLTFVAALAGVGASLYATVWSRTSQPPVDQQLSALLAVSTVVLLMLVVDRLVVRVNLESAIGDLADAVRSPQTLTKYEEATPFDDFVRDADSVLIVGLTKAGGLTEGPERLIRQVKSGCKVRILVMDQTVPNLFELTAAATTHSPTRLAGDYSRFVETIKAVRKGLSPRDNARLVVRTYNCVWTSGVVLVTRGSSTSAQVYFYPYMTDPADRPALELTGHASSEWIEYFKDRYEQLWSDMADSTDPSR